MATPKELMQIGSKLIEHCNKGEWKQIQQTMYAQDAVSAEAVAMPGQASNEAVGLEAIIAKGDWWESAHEVHSSTAEGPFVHGDDKFSVIFDMDVTNKESGQRMQMREVGQYFVNAAGHITREEFSYPIQD